MREIRVLQTCQHPNIVHLKKVVTGSKPDSIFLVFEYCSHDLGRLVDMMPRPFSQSEVKCLMLQVSLCSLLSLSPKSCILNIGSQDSKCTPAFSPSVWLIKLSGHFAVVGGGGFLALPLDHVAGSETAEPAAHA